MQWLEHTEPHFVRCIKSNTLQHANLYQDDLVLQQLRCCGILEIVRISKAGYPTRVSHQSFAGKWVISFSFHWVDIYLSCQKFMALFVFGAFIVLGMNFFFPDMVSFCHSTFHVKMIHWVHALQFWNNSGFLLICIKWDIQSFFSELGRCLWNLGDRLAQWNLMLKYFQYYVQLV